MKKADLMKKDIVELQDFLKEAEKELESLRFAVFAGEERNVRKLRKLKKDIARAKTRINHLSLTQEQK